MTQLQKVIKYLAIAFAIFLIVAVASGICGGIASVSHLLYRNSAETGETVQEVETDGSIKNLNVDIGAAELVVKEGEAFKAESDSEYIDCFLNGSELTVKEKRRGLFGKKRKNHVTIYIPKAFTLDTAYIEAGAGKVSIDTLSAEYVDLEIGAGEMKVNELYAKKDAEIDCGAGEMTIGGGSLSNLDLDIGMGAVKLTSALSGNSAIDIGIGEADIHLIGSENDYSIKLNKGVGEATLDGEKMRDNTTYGNGAADVKIDGGIGAVKIDFVKD